MSTKAIAYRFVSTARRGQSQLDLEAQTKAVVELIHARGKELLQRPVRGSEASRAGRPAPVPGGGRALQAEAPHPRNCQAGPAGPRRSLPLRSPEAGRGLCGRQLREANKLTTQLIEAVAEHERKMISKRNTEALAAAKAQDVKLGSPSERGAKRGLDVIQANTSAFAANVAGMVARV